MISFQKPGNALKKVFLALSVVFLHSFSANAADGEKLFKQNCSSCHSTTSKKVVGPGLEGIDTRWTDKEMLYKWVNNSQELIKSGYPQAVKVYEEFGKAQMPPFPSLSAADLDAIFDYVKNPPVKQEVAKTDAAQPNGETPGKLKDNTLNILLISLVVVFLILIGVLGKVRKSLSKLVNEKNGGSPAPEYSYLESARIWCNANKTLVGFIILAFVAYAGKVSWYWMKDIGVYEGYMPEQPIKYSHKLHAGKNAIDCRYCHYNAYKGKVAGVPSANVCMNCHKYVQEGPQYGKTEIAKIYNALDYNPESQQYGPNKKPIKWVRVHALPDHVYFNHSQHVVAGQIECQKCHGPIQEMDTVRQFSPLTMGWCINCHRETEVKMAGNDYYTDLHNKLKTMYKGEKITVAKMGGLDCAKCHY